MIIRIYYSDHNPPHFHVQYAEQKAVIEIRTGKILYGKLPNRLLKDLEIWRKKHLFELHLAWNKAQALLPPNKIEPLE